MAASANPAVPPIPVEEPRQHPLLALLCRLVAGLALATMLMLVKLGKQRGIDLPQMMFVRQFVTIPVLLGWLALRGQLHVLRTTRLKNHAARAATGTVGMALTFMAPMLLPLAVATTFGFTSPIFAVILSALVLREHVGAWRWTATAVGFVGVAFLADPIDTSVPPLGALVAIAAAFMVALVSIQIRDLTKTEHPLAIVTWFALFATPVLFVISLLFNWNLSGGAFLLLVMIGLTGTVAQILITLSLRLGPVSSVIVMDYMTLLWATAYGVLVFDTLPPASLWIGAPFVIASGSIIVWRERILAKQRNEMLAR